MIHTDVFILYEYHENVGFWILWWYGRIKTTVSLPPFRDGGTDHVKHTATLPPTNYDGYDAYHNTFKPVYPPTFHPVSAATASMDGVDSLPVFNINTHLWNRHPVAVAEYRQDIDSTAPLYDQLDLSSSALTNPVALATLRDGLNKYGDVFRGISAHDERLAPIRQR